MILIFWTSSVTKTHLALFVGTILQLTGACQRGQTAKQHKSNRTYTFNVVLLLFDETMHFHFVYQL